MLCGYAKANATTKSSIFFFFFFSFSSSYFFLLFLFFLLFFCFFFLFFFFFFFFSFLLPLLLFFPLSSFLSFGQGSALFAFVEERAYTGSSCRGISSDGVGAISQTPHHFRQCSRVHESNSNRLACRVWSADCVWRLLEMPSLVRILPVTYYVSVILVSHSNTQST